MPPTSHTNPSIPTLLTLCKTLSHLHQLHAHIIRKGLDQDHYIISRLLSFPSIPLPYSTSIFTRLTSPSTLLFNILLKLLSHHNNSHFNDVVSLFTRLQKTPHARPDKYSFPPIIKACASECRLKEGESVHGLVLKNGFDCDVYVESSLIDFYGKCREILSARKVFDGMFVRNVVSWTAMVVGYVNAGDLGSARVLFDQMPERNLAAWNAIIGALVKAGELRCARQLFDEMPERDVVSFTVLIDGYAKAGDMAAARALFEVVPVRDIVVWTALISGYVQNGQADEAVRIFQRMEEMNVKPDEFIVVSLMSACSQLGSLDLAKWVDGYLNGSSIDLGRSHVVAALIDMNAKCGNMERARKLFENMPKRDLITYCSMIQGYSVHGCFNQAVGLFERMLNDGLIPDDVAFTVILTACSRGGLVEEGWHYFETMTKKYCIVPSRDHYACMVDLLSRAGRLNAAYKLLNSMPVEPDPGAWGSLLAACKLYGNVKLGEVVAGRLFELEPQNAGTYVLLSDIYAAANEWLNVSLVREKMKETGLRKILGRSWV